MDSMSQVCLKEEKIQQKLSNELYCYMTQVMSINQILLVSVMGH